MTAIVFPESLTIRARRAVVGISGGADSTYLAWLAHQRLDHVVLVHINHELRGAESEADEQFCRDLASLMGRPLVVERRSEIERLRADLPANPSARYRYIRHVVFRSVLERYYVESVLLAHHADDQAETVFLRLSRGSGIHGLRGMHRSRSVAGIPFERPLLEVRASAIRDALRKAGQPWRDDSSNRSPDYRRNIVRQILSRDPTLTDQLLELSRRTSRAIDALDAAAPVLAERFACEQLASLPAAIAEHAARRWLVARGAPVDKISPDVCQRLIRQAADPASPLRQHFPGQLLVRRRKKHLDVLSCDA